MTKYFILLPLNAVLITMIIAFLWSSPSLDNIFWIILFGLMIMGSTAIAPFFTKNETERIKEGMEALQ